MENLVKQAGIRLLSIIVIFIALIISIPIYVSASEPGSPPEVTIRFAPSPGSFLEDDNTQAVHTGQFGFRISSFPEPRPPAGYIFIGWFSNGIQIHPPIAAIRNTTILAAYAPIPDPYATDSFAIVFDPGEGLLPQGVQFIQAHTYGSPLLNLPTPTRENYTFGGWLWNEEIITAPYIIRSDMVIEATWVTARETEHVHTPVYPRHIPAFHSVAAFNPFPGTFSRGETGLRFVRNSTRIQYIPDPPTRSGAAFVGWRLPSGEILEGNILVREDIMLTAVWDTSEGALASVPPSPLAESRPNPQTNPIAISIAIFIAIACLALAAYGILEITKKRTAATVKYRLAMARYLRESRMVFKNRS
ncbi:MAG: InlB B-repeat-containing protein [Defluviitaleaceae bacterium]|nr:InlB B-repeat-containing protein [Defluviitaleaceae bacterium]